jgi:hypothetical protein
MEMIERVARAMLRAEEWSSFFGEDDARKLARAAIEAMREPTDAMLIDGAAKIRNFTSASGPYPRTRAVWLSMIDASLANYPVKPDSSLDPQVND